MMGPDTQASDILAHFRKYGSITSIEAFNLYGYTRLSAVIYTMRKQGYDVVSEMICDVNRHGRKVHFAKYSLKGKD